MNPQRVILSFLYSARKELEVARGLFKHKHYAHALFLCHLVLDKILKALVLKRTKELAPQIHDLRRLAEKAGLIFTEEQGKELDIISTFSIRARYEYLWTKRRRTDVLRGIEPVGFHPKDFIDENPLALEIKTTGIEIWPDHSRNPSTRAGKQRRKGASSKLLDQ